MCTELIEDFYDDLEKLLKMVPRKDIFLIVQGDWNAKMLLIHGEAL